MDTTKQNFHQRLNGYLKFKAQEAQLVKLIHEVRKDHPVMGAASLYERTSPSGIGRERFVQIYNANGFKLHQKKNYRKTTDSSGVVRFPNLLEEIELTGINQAYSSDITYYQINNVFFYLTFIMDLYSRVIKGHSVSHTLCTEDTTLPALKMALKGTARARTKGTVFHSDGGGQYYSKAFLALTNKAGLRNSMCTSVYENPHAERVNGTIKNSYLKHYGPPTFRSLVKQTKRAVEKYNKEKPHEALGGMTPQAFEKALPVYPQKPGLLTKKKGPKKKEDNDNSNHISQLTPKTVNPIQ
jgi:transposase InsO family protein